MRPVQKQPQPYADSVLIEIHEYRDAKKPLFDQVGPYCSYCEQPIKHMGEVEHFHPKKLYPEEEKDWNNLILSCKYCNTCKLDFDTKSIRIVRPDRDNTARAFQYDEAQVRLADLSDITDSEHEASTAATELWKLIGLDRWPGGPTPPTPADNRWRLRQEAWDLAQAVKQIMSDEDTEAIRKLAVVVMKETGFWSVFMTVFADDPDMLSRFITEMPGTASDCFDDRHRPVPRPDGII